MNCFETFSYFPSLRVELIWFVSPWVCNCGHPWSSHVQKTLPASKPSGLIAQVICSIDNLLSTFLIFFGTHDVMLFVALLFY